MHTFFHGWRRKAGVVALGLALMLASLWLRTQAATDLVIIQRSGIRNMFHSYDGRVIWCNLTLKPSTFPPKVFSRPFEWKTYDQPYYPYSRMTGPVRSNPNNWDWEWHGVYFGQENYVNGRTTIWAAPYWIFTIPLTLISAYLLLWKPRKRA